MAKKKTQSKKHKFKHVETTTVNGSPVRTEALVHEHATEVVNDRSLRAAVVTSGRDFSYVAVDLRRISVMALSLVMLELLLWWLLSHTGVGDAVYSFVKF